MDASAGQTDLPGVIAQMRGTLDEDDAVRCVAKDADDYGGLAANRLHVSELAQKTCVPCRGGVPPLTSGESAPLLAQLDAGWQIVSRHDDKRGTISLLERTFRFDDFAGAMRAAVRVGEIAEEQQHHPDLTVAWGRLRVEIWTHKIGGLTESDFVFAAKCDEALRRIDNG
jgi:4a-hydroxytetrahydrobiopterin dehydratase